MTSKTRMLELVKGFDWVAVEQALAETPALLAVRDERGRTWLHIACARPPKSEAETAASIKTVDVLIAAGLDISDAAFTEEEWRATPLWCAIGRGRNLALARHLLELGCDPEHCLWAATFARDHDAIRLLVAHGAKVDALHEEGTPFIGAIKISRFEAAEVFLELGANADAKDRDGLTALHLMLKKGSEAAHVAMLIRHGARGDIRDPEGQTAVAIMRRKKDPDFRRMAEQLARGGGDAAR
jgi:ankyrin repeat protein